MDKNNFMLAINIIGDQVTKDIFKNYHFQQQISESNLDNEKI